MTDQDFELVEDFRPSVSGGLGLGILESQYQELFAEALEDGVITSEERERLEKAAENMGLDLERLGRLEEAMTTAYETHHRRRVVDQSRAVPQASITPLQGPPPLSVKPKLAEPSNDAADGVLESLRLENAQLRQRIEELEGALAEAQAAVNVEIDLGDLDAVVATSSAEPEDVWKRIRHDPTDVEAYRTLRDSYDHHGQADGVFLAHQALVALGAASAEEQAAFEAGRPQGLIAPRSAILPETWSQCLVHPEQEHLTGAIFSVVAPAILLGRVTTLRRDGLLHVPAQSNKQDPNQSTLMAVRAVGWAAALLGLATPPVFVESEREAPYTHVPGVPPLTVVGRGALSGQGAAGLAYLVGAHLSGYRGEHFVRTLFSATEDLEDLFLAALLIANTKLPLQGLKRARVEPLARAIEPMLDPAQHDALRGYYLRFAEEGGRTNLQRWAGAVDKTASRVGLALSQDLPRALEILRAEEGPQGPRALDLLAFSTSSRFLKLRESLGLSPEVE